MSRWLHCPYFVLSVNAGERYDIASAELLGQATEKQGSGGPGRVVARNLVGTFHNLQMYECCQWPDKYAKSHPSLVRGTPSMRIAPSTLPRCHVWANDSRSLGSMTKLPNQHHRCNPRMRDDEWPEQLSCIASREGTAALHFSGSSSSVRSLVQEHAVFKWALAHMAVPARSPISSARASSWRGRGRNRAPRFKSGPLEVYFIPARSLAHFSRTV